MVRTARLADVAAVTAIYNHYVAGSIATFEEEPVAAEEMARRMAAVMESYPWKVWEEDGKIAGYAYAAPWLGRSAYRFTAETTVYVAANAARRGIGSGLYRDILDDLQVAGYHAVIGGISLPNPASVALHEKLGYRRVALFKEVGFKFGRWIDVGYWQKILA